MKGAASLFLWGVNSSEETQPVPTLILSFSFFVAREKKLPLLHPVWEKTSFPPSQCLINNYFCAVILTGVKLSIANRKARSLPKKEIAFGEEKNIGKIGIILDSFDQVVVEAFEDFVQGFHLNEGSAEIVYCLSKGSNDKSRKSIVFKGADISWSGKVTSTCIAAFLDRHFDLVVCFTKGENKLVEYLLTALDADLKVGRQQEKDYLCDVSISSSFEEVDLFISEVKKYLKILNRIS